MILIVTAVAIAVVQQTAQAASDTLDVSAKVSATRPTAPAVISNPVDGSSVSLSRQTVSGTCQALSPATLIALYDNGQFSGSTTCQADGRFELTLILQPGDNVLLARSANLTDDYGPDSPTIRINYTATVAAVNSNKPLQVPNRPATTSLPTVAPDSSPLRLASQQTYLLFDITRPAVWEISLSGGLAPYQITVDWGDGQADNLTDADNQPVRFSHDFNQLTSYFPKLIATDASGQQLDFSIACVTLFSPLTTTDSPAQTGSAFLQTTPGIYLVVYVTYLTALTLFGLAWYDAKLHRLRFAGRHIFPRPMGGLPR